MSGPSCKTCAYCEPASDPKAARSYFRCTAPISMPDVPRNGSQWVILQAAITKAIQEPNNWTTIAHVEGKISTGHVAGSNCLLWKERGDKS